MKPLTDFHPTSHYRRQLQTIRACAIFFIAWFILDQFLHSYVHFTLLISLCFGAASFISPKQEYANLRYRSRAVWLFGPPISLLMVELLNNTDPFEALTVTQGILNLVWYYLLFTLLQFFFGRMRLSASIASVICFAIGLMNHYVLVFRGRIIFPCDLVGLRTALNVAGGFDYTPDETILRAASLLIAYLFILSRLPRQNTSNRPSMRATTLFGATVAIYCIAFFGTGMLSTIGIYAQQWKTQTNGFVLNFTAALRYSIVTTPKGYSPKVIEDITAQVPAKEPTDGQQPVHIIGIMNESFADLASYETLSLTEDAAPFLHSMKENTIKGTMYSPVTGGGTANVEFEFLTGNSLTFLPPSTVAYQLYLREQTPSLVSQLKPLGYSSVAFHPYHSSGWNRPSVYKWMGFDQQLYDEDVNDPTHVRSFISDKSDYEKLYELTDQAGNDPLFIFNVTIQNHSGYSMPWTGLERTSELSGELENGFPSADQYFSLIRESDDALQELIHHYSNSDVPTMIVFFGDHQPPLGNDFYEELTGKPLDNRDTAEVLQQYETPFFIWANYDIPEQENVKISTWGLNLLTAQAANLPLTGYQRFLGELVPTLPVITPVGSITADGRYADEYETGLTEYERDLIQKYRYLSYNNLFGKDERADNFFFPS